MIVLPTQNWRTKIYLQITGYHGGRFGLRAKYVDQLARLDSASIQPCDVRPMISAGARRVRSGAPFFQNLSHSIGPQGPFLCGAGTNIRFFLRAE